MTAASRSGMGWPARLMIALVLILLGAAAAVWALSRYHSAARVLGVVPPPSQQQQQTAPASLPFAAHQQAALPPPPPPAGVESEVADLRARLQRVENATMQAQGSAGRADALVVAFAARRAIDRGTRLGYLEPLLIDRFGARHPDAVATVVTASRTPIRLADLISDYKDLRPALLASGPGEGFWTGLKREFGSLINIRQADRPSTQPEARYERALSLLTGGQADAALAETMRLPGAERAADWIARARQYVSAHRALDQLEAAALLGNTSGR